MKVSAVPQIDGLTIEDFLKHARRKTQLLKFLPDEKDWNHLDKKWVCDILYSQDQAAIQDMITKAMINRKQRIEQSQNQLVGMRPEFS